MVKVNLNKTKMTLDEFLGNVKQGKIKLHNSKRRLYSAIMKYGVDQNGSYNFIHKQENDDRDIKDLYGLDREIGRFVRKLKEASEIPDEENKIFVIIGAPGVGKSNFINTLEQTLKAYSKTDEGKVYYAKADLKNFDKNGVKELFADEGHYQAFIEDLKESFGGISNVKLSLAKNIQTTLNLWLKRDYYPESEKKGKTKMEEAIDELNSGNPEYKVRLQTKAESSPIAETKGKLVNALMKNLADDKGIVDLNKVDTALEKVLSIEEANPQDVILFIRPAISPGEKNFDYKGIIGGNLIYKVVNKTEGDNASALAYDYGVLGSQVRPSPTEGLVVLSEILKGDTTFKNVILDVVEETKTQFSASYTESFDAVLVGTTNMNEYSMLSNTIQNHLTRRVTFFVFKGIHKMKDAKTALEDVFKKKQAVLDYHLPPHFVRMLSRVWAETSISEYPGVPLKRKADIYDGVDGKIYNKVEGKEDDAGVTIEDLRREADEKTILEREEGMKLSFSYNDMMEAPTKLFEYASSVQRNRENKICLASILSVEGDETVYLKDFVNTLEDLSPETKTRLSFAENGKGNTIISDAYSEYIKNLTLDLNKAMFESEAYTKTIERYVMNVYHLKQGHTKYQLEDIVESVDKKFVEDIEGLAKGINSDVLRTTVYNLIRNNIDFRRTGTVSRSLIKSVGNSLLDDYTGFSEAVSQYLLNSKTPELKIGLDKDSIIQNLKKLGYCDECANVAYALAKKRG